MVGVGVLRREHVARRFMNQAWQRARAGEASSGRTCPHCRKAMALVEAQSPGLALELDVCLRCACIWFDPGEHARAPRAAPPPGPEVKELPPELRERLALARCEQIRKEYAEKYGEDGPDSAWQVVPAVFGFPVECGVPSPSLRPWVTWGVAAAAAALFLLSLLDLEAVVNEWGFTPAAWHRRGGLTVASSFFLHAGAWHLIGNMYFLLVFGDNVEDDLGKRRFALLLAASHVVGMIAHGLWDPRAGLPCVGASAGISGVIAYYAAAFPRARLGFMVVYWFRAAWFHIPAAAAFALWMLIQLVGAWKQVSGFSSVSALAHLGGAAVGLAAALKVRSQRRTALASP
jgi:membrane associated rhomboid family serine protease